MSAVGYHLVRRGLEAVTQSIKTGSDDGRGNNDSHEVPAWYMLPPVATAVFFAVLLFCVGVSLSAQISSSSYSLMPPRQIYYVYGMVVLTLTIIEDPQPELYVPLNSNDDDDSDINKASNNISEDVVPTKPVTSKLRNTIRHLRARAGRWSCFRGLGIFWIWCLCNAILVGILSFNSTKLFVNAAAQVASDLALATVSLAWVHIVISEPSTKPFYKRISGPRNWMRFAPAMALKATVSQLGSLLVAYLGIALHVLRPEAKGILLLPPKDGSPQAGFLAGFAVLALAVAWTILIEVPATVIAIRVAASMLPADDEVIVPFDRTFGGRVTSTDIGRISLLDAWRSFTWPSYVRLLKVLGKTCAILMGVFVLFCLVFVAEVALLPRDVFDKIDKVFRDWGVM